jgi:hypothetical protein
MAYKNHYKKIFVIGAALFVLFAPVGMTIRGEVDEPTTTPTLALASSSYSTFHLSFNLNLAEATDTPVVIGQAGTAAGANQTSKPNVFSCATNLATCGVYYVSLVVNGAMGLLLSGGAFLVKLGLQFNDHIFDAPAVQTGFSVSLAIANLGFVLGIIIIAIATIIRNQTYGIKQLLWKLVMMAILVNFGLVITAPIIGFANSMSTYFVNATSPSAATGGYGAYVNTMMSAFNPQAVTEAPAVGSSTAQTIAGAVCSHWISAGTTATLLTGGGVNITSLLTACKIAGVQTTSPNDNIWQSTMALLFDIAFSAIAAFAFICLAILLIIRYLMLGGLLIVLPLAWLTYVFPKFDNSFSRWWNTFVKWVFFPPLALFFIYLAFTTAALTGGTNTTSSAVAYTAAAIGGTGSDNSIISSLSTQTGIGGGVFAQAADEVLLVGLMIMGLMFANSLSGKAGSTVVNGAASMTKAAAGYVGRRTGRAAGRAAARVYQRAGGEDFNAALQRSRIPGLAAAGRGIANLTEAGTKNQVDARHKALGLGAMDDDRLTAATQGLRGKADQLAALQEWQKRGKLDKIDKIGGGSLQEWLSNNQGTLKDYKQGKLSGDIDNAVGSNEEMRTIARGKATAGATAEVVDEKGIISLAGITVSANDLKKGAKDAERDAQGVVDAAGADTIVDHNGRKVKAGELLADAKAATAAADDAIKKKGDMAMVIDTEGRLGAKGEKQEAGDLMQAAAKNFLAGKDKGDIGKMNLKAIFGNKPKFGLDEATLREIGRSITQGLVTIAPGNVGSIAGKLDNAEQLDTFTTLYKTSIEDARKSRKIDNARAEKLNDALEKLLAGKLSYMGGGEREESTPIQPVPPPTKT